MAQQTRTSTLLLILAMLALNAMVLRADDPTSELPSPPKPGRFTVTIKSGGFDRVAHVHIPNGFKVGTSSSLVLVLHGAGGNGTGTLDKDGWAAKADKEGFIAVAPDGLPALPRLASNFRTNPPLWNSGQLKARSPRTAIDDVAFIRQLMDELKDKVPYDERRVFCTGHSNGGGMTFRLAAELSERFTAIGTVAGLMAIADPMPKKPLPTLFILATKDPLMPIDGGEVKLPWGTRQNPPVSESLEAWAKALGCETEPKTISEKDGLKKIEYPRLIPRDLACFGRLKKRTLTNLYNERPTWLDLAHRKLDEAVFAAYGWSTKLSDDELLAKLLELNLNRSRAEANGPGKRS